jgi:hypothetical protein
MEMNVRCAHDELVAISSLKAHPQNRNSHPQDQIERLARILAYQGWRYPVKVSKRSGFVTSGHGRIEAAKENGWNDVPVNYQDYDNEEQEYADVQADNAIASWSELDLSEINADLGNLGPDFDIDMLGIKNFVLEPADKSNDDSSGAGSLVKKFGAPPFSVLDSRQDYWMKRKREWEEMGIESAAGRDENLSDTNEVREGSKTGFKHIAPATSVFDPVLAELAYRWFCPPKGTILDPFAGGSVRGIVANKLDRQYIGIDIRGEQCKANREQADKICHDPMPVWHEGDSRLIGNHCAGVEADLIFSCPPYADLEVYSDDQRDISNMPYEQFKAIYTEIIIEMCKLLRQDRFACFVVGEVRDKKTGIYRNFVGDTIEAFLKAGLSYYNEAILINQFGTAAMRANKTFTASRKLIKVHQNVLVFCKGNPKAASGFCDSDLVLPESGVGASE